MRHPEWPAEDIVFEICWNGDPDDCQVIPREFLPDEECQHCKHYSDELCGKKQQYKEPYGFCDDYEWNEDIYNLRDEPCKPKRKDFRSMKSYLQAMKAYRQWWLNYKPDDDRW